MPTLVHGTAGGYTNHRCRCDPCRSAATKASGEAHFKRKYGITKAEKRAMIEGQNWLCAACGESVAFNNECLDHDHTTGKVRAILCVGCNTALGMVNDSVAKLQSLIQYLQLHEN